MKKTPKKEAKRDKKPKQSGASKAHEVTIQSAPKKTESVSTYIPETPFVRETSSPWKKWLVIFLVAALSFSYYYYTKVKVQVVKETSVISRGSIDSSLLISGKIVAIDDATLSFERSGAVTSLPFKEGDTVKAGDTLIKLSAPSLVSDRLKAEANLAKAEADVRNLLRGASKEQIALKEQAVSSSNESLSSLYSTASTLVSNSETTLRKEIQSTLSPLFTLQTGGVYKMSFDSCDRNSQGDVETKRLGIEKTLKNANAAASSLSDNSTSSEKDAALSQIESAAREAKSFVTSVQDFLSNDCNSKDVSLATFRTITSASLTAVSASLTEIQNKKTAIITQKNLVEQAKKDLLLTQSSANVDQYDSLYALVLSAKAAVQGVVAEEQKTLIKAPFDGVISKLYVSKGENASLASPAVSLLSSLGFQAEGYVREIDVASLAPEGKVTITLDAFPKGTSFEGLITRIDPTPVSVGGVPLYRVLASLGSKDERVRDGMSAKLSISLYHTTDALIISPRFVRVENDGKAFVLLVSGGTTTEKEISIGRRGDDGNIEVVSGLSAGDVVELAPTATKGVQKGVSSAGAPQRR